MALFCRFAVSKPAHPLINSRRHDARPSVRRGGRRSTPEQSYNLASRSRVIIARSGGIGNESLVYPRYSPTPTARSHEALRHARHQSRRVRDRHVISPCDRAHAVLPTQTAAVRQHHTLRRSAKKRAISRSHHSSGSRKTLTDLSPYRSKGSSVRASTWREPRGPKSRPMVGRLRRVDRGREHDAEKACPGPDPGRVTMTAMTRSLSEDAMRESERVFAPQFTRTDDGWIFTTSGLGVGPRSGRAPERSYLVDDRQKAELLARLARRRSALRLPGILVIVVMFAVFGFAFWSFHHSDWARGALLFVSAIAAIVLFGEVIAPSLMLLALRPVLAHATPPAIVRVPHDVSLANELLHIPRALARWFSWPWLALACLFFAGTAIGELTRIGRGFDPIFATWLLAMTVICGVALYLDVAGRRQ